MAEKATQDVRHRRVFYIPGYDPHPPRRYRELYRAESKLQADISRYEIALTPKNGDGNFGWQTTARIDNQTVRTDFEVLVWSDIVRRSMSNSIPATYGQLLRTGWVYLSSGAWRRLTGLRKGPILAAFYPVGMLLMQAVLALLMFRVAQAVVERLGYWALQSARDYERATDIVTALGLVAGAAAFVLVLRWFRALDHKIYAYYLMHNFAYSARWRGGYGPEIERRIAQFAEDITAALESDADEVLVVGHSSGAHLAISVLADLLRSDHVPANGPELALLTLGQVVPMVSFLPDAHRLRADLRYLSQRDEITWIDVTAPGDGCAFALCDPVSVSGMATPEKRWPLVISAAFSQTLSKAKWRSLRWRFFRLHFQYLCAFDRVGDYDYFRITAGPRTLREHFENRAPSRSRIDVALSGFTSVAA